MTVSSAELSLSKDLVISSDLDELTRVELYIDELNSEFNFREDVYGNILIAVTEAVNNAITHGNKQDPSKRVYIRSALLTPYLLSIKITDEGQGFDYNKDVDPTTEDNIMLESGRGLFVMRHLADALEYSDGGRSLEMRFNI